MKVVLNYQRLVSLSDKTNGLLSKNLEFIVGKNYSKSSKLHNLNLVQNNKSMYLISHKTNATLEA